MKILVIGGGGMLGHKLVQVWRNVFDVRTTVRGKYADLEKYKIYELGRVYESIDVADIAAIEKIVGEFRPAVIVNAVGIIKQLPSAQNVIEMLRINSIFPHQLAELAGKYEARLITVGTDCVFDGAKGNYTEEDTPNATDLYGKSKNLGEVAAVGCLTLRTSIIGRELHSAHSLVEWFLSNEGRTVRGYANAIYTGFPTVIFAEILTDVILNHPQMHGLYQVSSAPIDKYELLELIRDAYGAKIEIERFEDFVIDRSLNSEKFRAAAGFQPLDWQEMIERMAADDEIYRR